MTSLTLQERAPQAQANAPGSAARPQWVFLSRSSLPSDPRARRLEKRGRWWLVLSFVLCPCHLPITLALTGAVFGGTALGATVVANALWVGVVLTVLYALVLWRGFRHIRSAKRLLADGETLSCTPTGCAVDS